jgi:hypothetical protein
MGEPGSLLSRRWLTVVCVLLSAHFAIAYSTLTTPMVTLSDDLASVRGPFAYRMLPTMLWEVTVLLLRPLHRALPKLHMPSLNRPFTSDRDWYLVLLTFACMLGTLTVARRLLRAIDGRWGFEWMALGVGYMAYFDSMLVLNRNLSYPYDLTALFLFTVLVYLAYRGRPVAFTLMLAVAMVNKETASAAILIYFGLQFGRRPLGRLVTLCAAMTALVVAIRTAQRLYLSHATAMVQDMSQNQLRENLLQMRNPLFWVSEVSIFGFAWIAAVAFWRYVPARVRVMSATVFLLWFFAMTVAGVLREVRIFSELSALLLLVVGLGVHGWLEQRSPREAV